MESFRNKYLRLRLLLIVQNLKRENKDILADLMNMERVTRHGWTWVTACSPPASDLYPNMTLSPFGEIKENSFSEQSATSKIPIGLNILRLSAQYCLEFNMASRRIYSAHSEANGEWCNAMRASLGFTLISCFCGGAGVGSRASGFLHFLHTRDCQKSSRIAVFVVTHDAATNSSQFFCVHWVKLDVISHSTIL